METHIHADHLTAAAYLKSKLPGSLIGIGQGIKLVHETIRKMLALGEDEIHTGYFDKLWTHHETFSVGSIPSTVIPTPGHTPDSISYLIGDSIFCGDSVFYPDVGSARCDFPSGNPEDLYNGIMNMYRTYPDGFKVFSGHDYPPQTRGTAFFSTLGQQKHGNKQLNKETEFGAFKTWRANRDASLGTPRLLYPSLYFNARAGVPPTNGFVKTPIKWLNFLKK